MTCTRCEGTGFLNLHLIPDDILKRFDESGDIKTISDWMAIYTNSDVSICDCCGDGHKWYGTPGEHFTGGDYRGPNGSYAYNGGLPECN
jgi:hypothetical protein